MVTGWINKILFWFPILTQFSKGLTLCLHAEFLSGRLGVEITMSEAVLDVFSNAHKEFNRSCLSLSFSKLENFFDWLRTKIVAFDGVGEAFA